MMHDFYGIKKQKITFLAKTGGGARVTADWKGKQDTHTYRARA
jgi:hypothetical protein